MPRLEDWVVIQSDDVDTAPEARPRYLSGVVYEHPKHKDGTRMRTSEIVSFSLSDGVCITHYTTYQLGKPQL